jgi:hypothetical protein
MTVSRGFLARAVECPRNLLPSPRSLSPLLQAQNIASLKWPPATYALGLPNTAAYAASLHGPLQLPPFPLPAPFFLTVARQSANTHLLTQPSFHFLSPLKDHLPPSRFWYHFQIVSRLYIAVLTLLPFALTSAGGLPSL